MVVLDPQQGDDARFLIFVLPYLVVVVYSSDSFVRHYSNQLKEELVVVCCLYIGNLLMFVQYWNNDLKLYLLEQIVVVVVVYQCYLFQVDNNVLYDDNYSWYCDGSNCHLLSQQYSYTVHLRTTVIAHLYTIIIITFFSTLLLLMVVSCLRNGLWQKSQTHYDDRL